jgi:hypothetical protein
MPCWHPSCPDQATGRGSWIKNDRHTVVDGYGHCIGVVVRIEHVSMAFPLRPSILSHIPANAIYRQLLVGSGVKGKTSS